MLNTIIIGWSIIVQNDPDGIGIKTLVQYIIVIMLDRNM